MSKFRPDSFQEAKANFKPLRRSGLSRKSKIKGSRVDKRETEWKYQVRERDNYSCRWPYCTVSSPFIHAHHICPRSQRPDLVYDVDNGACLCYPHHDKLHHTVKGREEGRKLGLLKTDSYELARKQIQS